MPYDEYNTPDWVTEVLVEDLDYMPKTIWEPACGKSQMANVLKKYTTVITSDIRDVPCDYPEKNFMVSATLDNCDAIITNPPYSKPLCEDFIRRAVDMMKERNGMVAMLLKIDFDSAKTRADIFADNPAWCRKLVLTKRIVWFEGGTSGPSQNHAWFIWDWKHKGRATISYGPKQNRGV